MNKAMQQTLREEPERFGLFNNGITIVVSDFKQVDKDRFELTEPYVVNGCQTTRSIWQVLDERLGAGGTGESNDEWRDRLKSAVAVVKIAKVGDAGDGLLNQITRYTNSQNTIREKDFVALDNNFRTWQRRLEEERGLYLEIQRGGWDSRRALQKQRPQMTQLKRAANAQELLKVYGAGWLAEPGVAFGKNPPFLPGGQIYERIMNREGTPFGADDLYAAYLVQIAGEEAGFGRRGKQISRRQTKYLFAFVLIYLLKDILQKAERSDAGHNLSLAVISVLENTETEKELVDAASRTIDDYMQEGAEDAVFTEEIYKTRFGYDLNRLLKWERLGGDLSGTPGLKAQIMLQLKFMNKSKGEIESSADVIRAALP